MNFGLVMTILMKFNLGVSVETMAPNEFSVEDHVMTFNLEKKIAIILMGCKPMVSDKIFCILEEKSCAQNIWCYVKPVLWWCEEGQCEGQGVMCMAHSSCDCIAITFPFSAGRHVCLSCHSEHRIFTLLLWEKPTHKTVWCIIHFLT